MASLARGLRGVAAVVLFFVACGENAGGRSPAPDPNAAGGAAPEPTTAGAGAPADGSAESASAFASRTITIHAAVPPSPISPGGMGTASWAAYAEGNTAWRRLTERSPGAYSFVTTAERWSVALVCDDVANAASTVTIIERTKATELDVTLDADCAVSTPPTHVVAGTLSNVPSGMTWLDFAYPLDARGSVGEVSPGTMRYKIANVLDGTWDLLYGVRENASQPITKIAILRAQPLVADTALDVDFASASAFVPGGENAFISGTAEIATCRPSIQYVTVENRTAKARGLPLVNWASPPGGCSFTYATVPAERRAATDRYLVEIEGTTAGGRETMALVGSFRDPTRIDLALPPWPRGFATTATARAPWLRLSTRVAPRAKAETYEVAYETKLSPPSHRRWTMSFDATLGTERAMPDLSAIEGFQPRWELAAEVAVDVRAGVRETAIAVGDGKLVPVATSFGTFTP